MGDDPGQRIRMNRKSSQKNLKSVNHLLFNYSMHGSIWNHWFSNVSTCFGADKQHPVQDNLHKNNFKHRN